MTEDRYLIVVNAEEQHSVWPATRAVPSGWRAVSEPVAREEALDLVATAWPDIRPLSMRRRLAARAPRDEA